MIAIIDYGAGNLFSVKNALDYLGEPSVITSNQFEIDNSDKIILPGVGAFSDAMKKLEQSNLTDFLKSQALQKPFLGICLGMQMLFTVSEEFGETNGLDLIKGSVKKIKTPYKLPHIGWNELNIKKESKLLKGLKTGDCVYFVHSFMANCETEFIAADTEYGVCVPGLVENENIYGAQFHPEKSGEIGLKILKNFCDI